MRSERLVHKPFFLSICVHCSCCREYRQVDFLDRVGWIEMLFACHPLHCSIQIISFADFEFKFCSLSHIVDLDISFDSNPLTHSVRPSCQEFSPLRGVCPTRQSCIFSADGGRREDEGHLLLKSFLVHFIVHFWVKI